jgi:sortase A
MVLYGDSGRTLAFGPGHNIDSSDPGALGLTMISGHRDTSFAFLRHLVMDDFLIIEMENGIKIIYKVANIQIIDTTTTSISDSETDTLALVTCWPFDSIIPGGPMRYVVFAERNG